MEGSKIAAELAALGKDFWEGVLHILPFFLAGVLIAAVIRTYRLHVRLRKHLPRFGFWGIFVATGVGVVSPLCACGVLPIMVSLLTTGLPLAPAMALLVASPLMSAEGYGVTYGLLGPAWAIAKMVAAVFMGLFTGFATHLIARGGGFETADIFRGPIPLGDIHDPDCDHRIACNCPDKWSNRVAKKYRNKFVIFWAKAVESFIHVGKFTAVGLVIEVLGARYIPQEWIAAVFGKADTHWYTTILVALAAVPLHVNQFTAAGILFGPVDILGADQIAWGPGMAFLIGGPVTALPAIGVFLSLFKPRVFWLYLGLCLAGTLIVAYTTQAILG